MSSRQYLSAQASALVGNASGPVKAACFCAAGGYLATLVFGDAAASALSITPGYLAPPSFSIWSLLTFWLIEVHLWEVCVDAVALGLCGKLVEPLWGRREMFTFFAVANAGSAALATAYYLLAFAVTRNADYLFAVRIHGLAGYVAGLAVAVKQVMPDHLLAETPLGKVTNRIIPLFVFIGALVLWAVGALEGSYPCMWACGTIVSWTYLRFWQRHSNGTRGDAAENFGFDNFFPTVMQPFVRAIWRPFGKCLARLGICPESRRRVHLALSPGGLTITLPGVEPQDMERRRQIALKALSERLSKTGERTQHKSRPPKSSSQVPLFQNPSVNLQADQLNNANISASASGSGTHRTFIEPVSPTVVAETTLVDIDPTVMPTPALNQQSFNNS